jgi:hypothetical protein
MKYSLNKSSIIFGLAVFISVVFQFKIYSQKNNSITKSEIIKTENGYRLILNNEPFYIKGAGLGNGNIEDLAKHGANALRTWSTHNAEEILDKAHENGLKVMMGIWVGQERQGFDYNDEEAVKRQLENIRKSVLKIKDHPALILWGIGNELNLHSKNPKVWDALNDISKMIHGVDPNHLTTTSLAGIEKKYVELVMTRTPDIDFLSTQLYAGIEVLPRLVKEANYTKPLLVTEWGATGYWEVAKTSWDAPIENNSSVKADQYNNRYKKAIEGMSEQVIGSFVFLWGQKQERTPTWFGMLMPGGSETESVDVMHKIWKGEWPFNRSPRIENFTLDEKTAYDNVKFKPNTKHSAKVIVFDPDHDQLNYKWEIMEESSSNKSGGDRENIPEIHKLDMESIKKGIITFYSPEKSGAYRLFVYIDDGNNHSAHANIPFYVEN